MHNFVQLDGKVSIQTTYRQVDKWMKIYRYAHEQTDMCIVMYS